MAIERFNTEPLWQRTHGPEKVEGLVETLNDLERVRSAFVEVSETSTSATDIRHGLGRVPRGIAIINAAVPSGTGGAVHWYREVGDDAWTAETINVRFTVADATVLLEVF